MPNTREGELRATELSEPKEVLDFCRTNQVEIIDFRFTDLLGTWQHFSAPTDQVDESDFTQGLGFDGSSIRGFQQIQESDMILLPDAGTAFVDPFCRNTTLAIICNVHDPVTLEKYSRDPRNVALKAEAYLKSTGVADVSYWGPELEFYVFDDVRFDQNEHSGYYFVDSKEGAWNTGTDEKPNLGHKPRFKGGYFPTPPTDTLQDFRSEAILKMKQAGVEVEIHHHEVGTAGQGEIDLRFTSLTKMGDGVMIYKHIVKNLAREQMKAATFMPKPVFMDNGSGMHTHQSLWKDQQNLFYDEAGYAQISKDARYYIGGLLHHAPALLAFCAPTTNSYCRLVPGYEAPINLAYSQRNRSACIRIPLYSTSPKAKRLEFRSPDPSANIYLAMSAMLMAGLDGIQNRMDPGSPLDRNIYDLPAEEAAQVKTLPGSLEESLNALERDSEFLLKGDVFTSDLIETWIDYKRTNELDALRLRPHPYEFSLYFDV
jgi:glutamine synthetase